MSTFNGIVDEFPDIRIDYFRPSLIHPPPLACFLSHVHSDHLSGLESLKAPFVYCSPATREMLMRLERFPHRINFSKGILESRKVTYRGLGGLLKPIPLETPTTIELSPGKEIQVTLFDANHCTGAVMFLIEGGGKAILYTGDLRSEPTFIHSLRRNPFLIEYTSFLKTLDCIYLDTSFTDPGLFFESKSEGLTELLSKVKKYPKDTVFHFAAWTFGYEEVWMALSKALNSQIHVDSYKMRIYSSLRGQKDKDGRIGPPLVPEASVLAGYTCGNSTRPGCLTLDPTVRIHSCEKGTGCIAMNNPNIVWIRPIITHDKDGLDLAEAGIGGGGGDLLQRLEVELDNTGSINMLLELLGTANVDTLQKMKKLFIDGLHTARQTISLEDAGLDREEDELGLQELVNVLAHTIKRSETTIEGDDQYTAGVLRLPKVITFPYSRHSSYIELREFVATFSPKEVFPCTVDEDAWHENVSVESLFGNLCLGKIFRHDLAMRELKGVDIDAMSIRSRTTERSEGELLEDTPSSVQRFGVPDAGSNSSVLVDVDGEPTAHHITEKGDHEPQSLESGFSAPIEKNEVVSLTNSQTDMVLDEAETLAKTIERKFPNTRRRLFQKKPTTSNHNSGRKHTEKNLDPFSDQNTTLVPSPTHSDDDETTSSRSSDESGFTPNTASQNARRKSILAAFQRAQSKRKREIWDDGSNLYSYFDYENENMNTARWDSSQDVGVDTIGQWDPSDKVYRCKNCGFEVWQPYGDCQGCDIKGHDIWNELWPEGAPYLLRDYPQVVGAHEFDSEVARDIHDALAENYMDNDSSAYDSYDDCPRVQDEYEIDSFIDDTKPDAQEASKAHSDTSSDELSQPASPDSYTDIEELNLENRYTNLLVTHQVLTERFDIVHSNFHEILDAHNMLVEEHGDLHHDFDRLLYGGDLYGHSEEDSDEDSDYGFSLSSPRNGSIIPAAAVDVQVQDPQLVEVNVTSQAESQQDNEIQVIENQTSQHEDEGQGEDQDEKREKQGEDRQEEQRQEEENEDRGYIREVIIQYADDESQASNISEGAIERRVEAWENVEDGIWSGLISTTDNHTTEEVEF